MKHAFKARYKITVSFLLFYMIAVLGFSYYRYVQIKNVYMAQVDQTLNDAAASAIFIVGREFHDRYDSQNPPEETTDYRNILQLSELARMHGIQYVYTLVKEGERVYFTASSATENELKSKEGISRFNDEYEEATDTLKGVFSAEKPLFEVSSDQWGRFRSILIPFKTEKGRVFVAGADIEIGDIDRIAGASLLKSLGEGFFFIAILIPFLIFVYRLFKEEKSLLRNMVNEKTKALTEVNETLEARIAEEIENNRKKDMILNQQTRMAAMGEMIGNIAHQWRQPITALSLLIQDLHEAYENEEMDKRYLEQCVTDSLQLIDVMSSTIDDFRNFFSPNKVQESFDVTQAVERSCNILKASLDSRLISLQIETEKSDVTIFGFPNEFSQVIMNLLNNAKDAIVCNEVKSGAITITIGRREDKVLIRISDNAGGVPAHIIDKIFDPYFTTKHKSQGTGIGLYMAKQIVEGSMGGKLSVRNLNGGAEFTIVI